MPIVMIPLGIMLIRLRAGDETPVIDLSRVAGFLGLYLVFLTAAQFIDAFNYPVSPGQTFEEWLQILRDVFLPISADLGRGGGRVGGFLYFNLISAFGELASVVILIGLGLLMLMFAFSLSTQDIYRFVLSIMLGFSEARRRRALRRAALRAEREARAREAAALNAGAAVSTPQIAASTPAPNALPAASSAAASSVPLPAERPAPVPVEARAEAAEPPRSIPITMGGRTLIAPLDVDSPAAAPANAGQAMATSASAAKLPTPTSPLAGTPVPTPIKLAAAPSARPSEESAGSAKNMADPPAAPVGGGLKAPVQPTAAVAPTAGGKDSAPDVEDGKKGSGLFGRVRGAL
ncbi:MAG: hypothetical protein NZM00_02060, partial [Anaerolinea sp.]|nr:hypothetical protein [Anaerolinea sp.]